MPNRWTSRCIAALLAATLAAGGCGPSDPAAEFRNSLAGPAGPTFKVADAVDESKLSGPDYTLGPTVTVYEDKYLFEIRTGDDVILAFGRNMFDLRLNELAAIQRARELGGASRVLEGTTDTAGDILAGAGTVLFDPVGTFVGIPWGFGRVVADELDATFGDSAGRNQRELAARLGCDAETRNPVLKRLIQSLLLQKGIGSLPVMVVPYTGGFMLVTWIQEELVSKSPRTISEEIEAELVSAGVNPYLATKFAFDPHFTTLQRLLFREQFRELMDVGDWNVLLIEAVESRNEAEVLAALETARMLADLHAERPIARLEHMGHPIAVLADGSHAICYSADYIVGSEAMAAAMTAYRQRYPEAPTEFICPGDVSAEARGIFERLSVTVAEGD